MHIITLAHFLSPYAFRYISDLISFNNNVKYNSSSLSCCFLVTIILYTKKHQMQTPDKACIVIFMIIVMKLTPLVAAASSIRHLNNSICHYSGPHGMQTGLRIKLAVCLSTEQNIIIYMMYKFNLTDSIRVYTAYLSVLQLTKRFISRNKLSPAF